MSNVLIFGLGYTALYFSKYAIEQGYDITATSREPQVKQISLNNLGINNQKLKIINFHNKEEIIKTITNSDYILISVPPKDGDDLIFEEFKQEIIRNKSHIKWIGYLSSTGVYGDHQGSWVDESSGCKGNSKTNLARLKAENKWMSLYDKYDLPVNIFRLSGIYGPKRSAIDKIKSGKQTAIYKENQFFSRIHVEDIAGVLLSSFKNSSKGEIFNLSDNKPAPSHEVDSYAAKLLNYPELKLINYNEADLSPMAKDFFNSNKKVSNEKIKKVLKYNLKFKDYKSGLSSIFESEPK